MSQKEMIEGLQSPEAYDEEVARIRIFQTHISYVFLTGKYAYKIKKPVNFGFLDFSTLEKRKHFCEEELRLNQRLCSDMYIAVLPITCSEKGIRINGDGRVVEYVLKMREIPQDRMMAQLLRENKVTTSDIDEIAKIIYDFHSKIETNEEIEKYGSLEIIKFNWDENFDQTREFIGKTIDNNAFAFISHETARFLEDEQLLFNQRVKTGKIRDCHGDLHSGNIFIADKVYIFDAIEFNLRFRYSDVAADVAFLTMDLDFLGKHNLSTRFLDRYVEYSGDDELAKVLPFYECYRAYVRGKVVSFRLNDPHVTESDKEASLKLAEKYFYLSTNYAKELT